MTESTVAASPFAGFISEGVALIKTQTAQANVLADKLKHAGNINALISEMRDEVDTTDENILAFREAKENLLKQLEGFESQIDEYIVSAGLVDQTPINVEAVTEQYKALAKTVKSTTEVIKGIPGSEEYLTDLPELAKVAGTRSGGSNATGVRRPRIASVAYSSDNGTTWNDVQKDGKATLTLLSQKLTAIKAKEDEQDYSGENLRDAMFKAAETDDLKTLDGKPVEFAVGRVLIKVVPSV